MVSFTCYVEFTLLILNKRIKNFSKRGQEKGGDMKREEKIDSIGLFLVCLFSTAATDSFYHDSDLDELLQFN